MKKAICSSVPALSVLLLVHPQPVEAGGHGRVFVGAHGFVGPGFWWPRPWWGPGWWGPPQYNLPPVVVQQPAIYAQAAPPPEEQQYWYDCQRPQGYYPYGQQCPNRWMKVVPPATPPSQ